MILGPLIPKGNILCVELQGCRPPQANFFEKWYFLFQFFMHFLYDKVNGLFS